MYKGENEIVRLLQKKKKMTVDEISKELKLHPDLIRRAIESLRDKGFVRVRTEEQSIFKPTAEYKLYVTKGFPEYSVYLKAKKGLKIDKLSPGEKSIGIRWAKTKGFIKIENGKLMVVKKEDRIKSELKKLEEAFKKITSIGKCDNVLADELFRRHLVLKKVTKRYYIEYTGKPPKELGEEKFNLNIRGPDAYSGKAHPMTHFASKVKDIMTELGFEEMDGKILESSFWNFDALFQPQDHPARELADTFYVDKKSKLPDDKDLVGRVKKSHEEGWGYKWKEELAEKTVLRTHTTCLSARYLAKIKDKKPRKYFAVGRVFRNEATDYKHLAEFHQIEGIVVWEKASFRDLLGVLKEIYKKLGFEKIRFRPSYFPYTEPSLEVEVFFEDRKQWMELGGAGIFRPEVSIPLCGVYPVLAWGLSLERPLMLALDLKDIREFYKNDLEFLRSIRLKL